MGKDTKRYRKIGKDGERWEKMGIDGSLIGEYGFSCDAANTHMLLNRRIPYLVGRMFCTRMHTVINGYSLEVRRYGYNT